MLDVLAKEMFEPHLGEVFELHHPQLATPLPLRLAAAQGLGSETVPDAKRKPFSLLFHGPLSPILPQAIYPLHHAAFADLEIFLVPLGPQGEAMRYEAVFT